MTHYFLIIQYDAVRDEMIHRLHALSQPAAEENLGRLKKLPVESVTYCSSCNMLFRPCSGNPDFVLDQPVV